MITLVLIKPNNFQLNQLVYTKNKNKFENIDEATDKELKCAHIDNEIFFNLTKDYLSFHEVEDDKFMDFIVQNLEGKEEEQIHIKDIGETYNNLYQQFYLDKPEKDDKDINMLASYLGYDTIPIYGNVIAYNIEVPRNSKEMKNVSMTKEDIIYNIVCNVLHTGVFLDKNGSITQIYYNNNLDILDPNYKFLKDNSVHQCILDKDYGEVENPYFRYNISFITKKADIAQKDSSSIMNPIGFRLLKGQVWDDIVVISKKKEDVFGDITKNDIINILKVCDKTSDIDDNDLKEEKDSLNRKIIINKYRILNNKVLKYS